MIPITVGPGGFSPREVAVLRGDTLAFHFGDTPHGRLEPVPARDLSPGHHQSEHQRHSAPGRARRRLVDPVERTVMHGSLWIANGRVVGRGADVPPGVTGNRIDLQGKWVIPGLVDLHTHYVRERRSGARF
jgi:hypothetical protein